MRLTEFANFIKLQSMTRYTYPLVTIALFGLSRLAFATPQTPAPTTTPGSIQINAAQQASTISVGLSSINPIPTTSATTSSGSVTALFQLTPTDSIQSFFAVPSTSGALNLSLGGTYKRNILGTTISGVHAGGGIGFGYYGNFAIKLTGVVGIHHQISGSKISAHFDCGPAFSVIAGSTSSSSNSTTTLTNFTITQASPLLGASLVYEL